MVSHRLGVVHQKERLSLQNKFNWVLEYGFNCRLVYGTEISLLVIASYDNSGFLGVVTLKSPGGFFAALVFSIRKQITVLIYLPLHFILIGYFFVLPRVCMLI